nr:tetratricopeptide repeat protein [candidate division Zixibacteria bacterium]
MNPEYHRRFSIKIVMALLAICCMIGCSSESGRKIVFKAEQLYNQAEKLKQKASIKPELNDTGTRDQIKQAYLAVTDYCWIYIDSLSGEKDTAARVDLETIAFLAANRLTQIYFAGENYDSVIAVSNQLLNFTNLKGPQRLTTELNLAFALQSRGDLESAVGIYHAQMDAFYPPVDNKNDIITSVLNLPLDIIKIYRMIGYDSLAIIETKTGETYYNRLISDWPNSALATAARSNLARLHYDAGAWDKAIADLSQLKDSTGQIDVEATMMIAEITYKGKKNYDEALKLYDQLSKRVQDTTILPMIMLRKGIALFDKKKYNDCREIMSKINDKYPGYFQNNSLPQKYIAMSFMKLGDWIRAENEYKWLIDNYSTSEAAFDAHLTIADHYQKANNKDLTRTWFRRAEEFYYAMARQYPGSAIEASAISYLAELARMQENWPQAAGYLEGLYNKFPTTDIGRKALVNAAAVYRDKLDNPAKADSLIERLKSELFPLDDSKNIDVITDDIK